MASSEPEKNGLTEPERETEGPDEPVIPETFAEKVLGIFMRVIPYVAACSVAGVVVLLLVADPGGEEADTDPAGKGPPDPPGAEATVRATTYTAEDFQREGRFREALINERGGRIALNNLRSLKVVGTLAMNGKQYSFLSVAKFPGRVLLRLSSADGSVSIGRDAEGTLWKTVQADIGSAEPVEVSAADESLVKVFGNIRGPLLEHFLEGSGRVVSVNDARDESHAVIRVVFHRRNRTHVEEVDLDPTTLSPLRWHWDDDDGNSVVTHYKDHRPVEGLLHPFSVEVWRNGEAASVLDAESVTPNFGAVDLLFRNPLAERMSPPGDFLHARQQRSVSGTR